MINIRLTYAPNIFHATLKKPNSLQTIKPRLYGYIAPDQSSVNNMVCYTW